MNKQIVNIKTEEIIPNTYQPRKYFNEEALLELSQSIKEHGIIQPLTVRKIGEVYGEYFMRECQNSTNIVIEVAKAIEHVNSNRNHDNSFVKYVG